MNNNRKTNRKSIMLTGLITSFITTFMGSGLNLAIPSMSEEFDAGIRSISWVVNVYMITCAALAVPFGLLADKIQRRKIFLAGIFLFTAGSLLAVLAGRLWVLLVFRFFQASGAAMIFSTNTAMMAAAAEEGSRGKIMGQAASANYMGLAAGPVIGGILTHNFGWQAVFVVTGAVSGLTFFTAFFKLPGDEATGRKGNIRKIISDPAYICANLAAMINYGANYIIGYLLSIYLQSVCEFSPQKSGFMLLISTVVMAVLAPAAGKLSDKIRPQLLAASGMMVCSISLIILIFASRNESTAGIAAALAASGVGFALFSSPNTNAVMACTEKENYSLASSVLSSMRSAGNALSLAAVNIVSALYHVSDKLQEAEAAEITATMNTVFLIFAILCILGIFMAMRRKI